MGDDESIRVLAAWPRCRAEWKRGAGKQPLQPNTLWVWMWRGVSFDLSSLSRAVRLSQRKTLKALRSCVVAGLLYPDGSRHGDADVLLEALAAKKGIAKRDQDA